MHGRNRTVFCLDYAIPLISAFVLAELSFHTLLVGLHLPSHDLLQRSPRLTVGLVGDVKNSVLLLWGKQCTAALNISKLPLPYLLRSMFWILSSCEGLKKRHSGLSSYCFGWSITFYQNWSPASVAYIHVIFICIHVIFIYNVGQIINCPFL
jgi:hypothetical protein